MERTDDYSGIIAETVAVRSASGEHITAYRARPLGPGPFPGMVLFHHRPGWDEWYLETTRRFAHHGFDALCPNLYDRFGHGSSDDVAARVLSEGDVHDDTVVADGIGCIEALRAAPTSTGKVGLFGTCSGGRHAVIVASHTTVDGVIDCWGGRIVMDPDALSEAYPVAPIDLTQHLSGTLLGLFGNDDGAPSPEQVDAHEQAFIAHDKPHEFHRYDGAGHGFFYYDRPAAYHAAAAVDGWEKIWDFCDRILR